VGARFRDQSEEDRVRVLIASTPAIGHLNPLLAIGRILIAEGHEIVGLSGNALRERIESIGAKFRPLSAGANFRDMVVPELKNIPPGLEWLRVAMERLLVDTIPAQHNGVEQVLRDFAADVIIGDDMFFGVLPKLLGPLETAPDCSLWHVDFALAPRRRGAAFSWLVIRKHTGTT
jgi:hypothetical protein